MFPANRDEERRRSSAAIRPQREINRLVAELVRVLLREVLRLLLRLISCFIAICGQKGQRIWRRELHALADASGLYWQVRARAE